MQFLCHNCKDAIESAISTCTYGVYFAEEQNFNQDFHTHECCEVFLSLSENNTVLIDGKIYDVNIGDLFIINQFEPHKIIKNKNNTFARFVLYIHPQYFESVSSPDTDLSHCFYTRGDDMSHKISLTNEEIANLQHLLITFRKDNGFGDDILKSSAVNTFLTFVNQHFIKYSKTSSVADFDNEIIKNTISYINEHFSEQLTLELLAKNSFVSVNQLCKIFKNSLDTTIAKYISSKRTAEAKKFLASGSSVSDTATQCGFLDYANFIRVFKKATGIPPGKYKKTTNQE